MKGFTLIEIILTTSILLVMAGIASPFFSNQVSGNNLEVISQELISSLRKAQNYSFNGNNNTDWGVCLFNSNIRLFQGTCATPTIKEDYSIPGQITVSGLNTITFSRLNGEPNSQAVISISNGPSTRTINISSAGAISLN